MFRLLHCKHQAKIEHSIGTEKVCTECTLSLYLDYVLFLPDESCVSAETCCLDDNYTVII